LSLVNSLNVGIVREVSLWQMRLLLFEQCLPGHQPLWGSFRQLSELFSHLHSERLSRLQPGFNVRCCFCVSGVFSDR